MSPTFPAFRLARDGRHTYLTEDGAFIGGHVPLLERDAAGHWRPRPQRVLERLLKIGYGAPIDLGGRMTKLAAVARALNAGDRSMAAIALVQAEIPPLPDQAAAVRMAKADGLGKAYDPNEPRDEHGQWTDGGETQVAEADTGTMSDAIAGPSHDSNKRPARSLSLSADGQKFIQDREASRGPNLSVYPDQRGKPTIGYGHLLKPGETFPNGISTEEAKQLLAQDIADAEQVVRHNVKVDLTQAQFDALVSFTYNEGPKNLARSTLLQRLNANDFAGAADEFRAWDKVPVNNVLVYSPGLADRRRRERTLFVSGQYR
jgi:lysozyme